MTAIIGNKEYALKAASVNYHGAGCNIDLRLADNTTSLDVLNEEITTNFNGTVIIMGTTYNVTNFNGINRFYNEDDVMTNAYFNNQVGMIEE